MWICENIENFSMYGVYYKIICTNFVIKEVKKTYRFSIIKTKKYQQCLNIWCFENTFRKMNKRKLSR